MAYIYNTFKGSVVLGSNFKIIRRCSCVSGSGKGLVLGAYADDSICLTPVAKCFDEKTCGRLSNALKAASGGSIKEGKAYKLVNIDPEYQSIAVVGIPKPNIACDDLEHVDPIKEGIRSAAAAGRRALQGIKQIEMESLQDAEAAAEGCFLSIYKFQEYRMKKDDKPTVNLYDSNKSLVASWNKGKVKAEAQNWARYLMDIPANLMTPSIFADLVTKKLNDVSVDVKVYDEAWAREKKMFSFLSVARGSNEPPKFLEIRYKGSECSNEKPYVLVGKGITFDTGGLSLKPSLKMDRMRADMGGAACVVSAIYALACLKAPVHVVGLIPLTENMPSGKATKPGDVFFAMNGKSICVDNTDAEGRLILADALSYTSCLCPKWILDIATLTGAMLYNLGEAAPGVYSNNNKLFNKLQKAGAISGDRVWRLPLWRHYTEQISGYDGYDLSNLGRPGGGNSNTAAAFLREFVPEKVPWIHMDIYNVLENGDTPYISKEGFTGKPTRTVIEFVQGQSEKVSLF